MFNRLIYLSGVCFILAITQAAVASAAPQATESVAGGYYPQASLVPATTYIEGNESSCTASLIAPKRVLTAAHCVVDDLVAGHWKAFVGARDTAGSPGQVIGVTGIAVHPQVSLPNSGLHVNHAFYDLAVLFLKRASTVPPVPIGTGSDWNDVGTALGWGHWNYDHDNPQYTTRLKAINLSLGTDSQCEAWTSPHYFPAIHICAYDYEGNDCITHGDSGGPLVVYSGGEFRQIGVTSFFPSTQSWGPCGSVSMVGFAWVAGPTLRPWPITAGNPACPRARVKFKRVKRIWTKRSKQFRTAKKFKQQACQGI